MGASGTRAPRNTLHLPGIHVRQGATSSGEPETAGNRPDAHSTHSVAAALIQQQQQQGVVHSARGLTAGSHVSSHGVNSVMMTGSSTASSVITSHSSPADLHARITPLTRPDRGISELAPRLEGDLDKIPQKVPASSMMLPSSLKGPGAMVGVEGSSGSGALGIASLHVPAPAHAWN